LALFLFTDTGPDDAPTRLICGSHLYVALDGTDPSPVAQAIVTGLALAE
jgi:hypothetical protein